MKKTRVKKSRDTVPLNFPNFSFFLRTCFLSFRRRQNDRRNETKLWQYEVQDNKVPQHGRTYRGNDSAIWKHFYRKGLIGKDFTTLKDSFRKGLHVMKASHSDGLCRWGNHTVQGSIAWQEKWQVSLDGRPGVTSLQPHYPNWHYRERDMEWDYN